MRPLLVTDCDEVLLHMVRHFKDWLAEAHGIDFAMTGGDFSRALTYRDSGELVAPETIWPLLDRFFHEEGHRQTLVPHAKAALARIAADADVVVLTNLQDHCHAMRIAQLERFGIAHEVVCNQGGKGAALVQIRAARGNPPTVFVDDLAVHHDSVARHAPDVFRLHMIAEPLVAHQMPPAPHAHARIDDWAEAADWIMARFAEAMPAEA